MSEQGLQQARDKMASAGVGRTAIEVFSDYYKPVSYTHLGQPVAE